MTSTPLTVPYEEDLLNLALTFSWTEEAHSNRDLTLLREGQYFARSFRKYDTRQRCDGCQTDEKAKRMVLIQDQTTGTTLHIGLDCLEKYYGVSRHLVESRISSSRKNRISLGQRMKRRGLSPEQQIELIWGLLKEYVPNPQRHQAFIEDARQNFFESDRYVQPLADLYEVALYHKEWIEHPQLAQNRYTALMYHPAFHRRADKTRIQQLCQKALQEKNQLPEKDIERILETLRAAQKHKSARAALTHREAHPNQTAYEQAVQRLLEERTDAEGVHHAYWDVMDLDLSRYLSFETGDLYAFFAVHPSGIESFKRQVQNTDAFRERGHPVVYVNSGERVHFRPAKKGHRRNDMNEIEEFDIYPEAYFSYQRVGVALVERHTRTHELWHHHTRAKLEHITSVLNEDQQ